MPRLYFAFTLIVFGLAVSALGTRRVSTPFSMPTEESGYNPGWKERGVL
jgi:hypothetical protein